MTLTDPFAFTTRPQPVRPNEPTSLAGAIALLGTVAGVLALPLAGCAQDQSSSPRLSALAEPADVRLSFPEEPAEPRDASRMRKPRAASLDQRPETEELVLSTDPSPRRVAGGELLGLLASDSAEMPSRLAAMERKAAEANALAQRIAKEAEAAPAASGSPTPTPAPRPQAPPAQPTEAALQQPGAQPPLQTPPPPSSPAASPALAQADPQPVPQPTVRPAPPTPTSAPTAAQSEVHATARALADAITLAMQKSATVDDAQRPIGVAVADALAAIGEPGRAFDLAAFPDLDEQEKAFVAKLHEASAAVGRDLAQGKPIGEAVARLAEAIKAVEPAEPLLVKRSEFATRVEGFGQLTPISNRRFLPGRTNQVILYTELDGFSSERNEKGEWITDLATKVQILAKHDGTEVWSRAWQPVKDVSSVRRDDFFVCEKVTLSEYLTVGTYILKVSVRDERNQAVAEKSVEFSMVADPALAAR